MREILRRGHRDGQVPEGADQPGDLWVRCPQCKELLYRPEHEQSLWVCSKCKYHSRLGSVERISITVDEGSFRECDADMQPVDPLSFSAGSRSYREKLDESSAATGKPEAFIYGTGSVEESRVVIGAIDINFIAGSMGSVVGEKVARAIETALGERLPLLLFSSSGGARMQEGVVALMQMAKVLARLDDLHDAGQLFLSIMTDPCYGGVTASFAMLGDVNIAEPGAYIGFAGPRVIEQTTRERLPPGAASAEFLLKHGMLDLVVARSEMRSVLSRLIRIYGASPVEHLVASAVAIPDRSQERDELRVGV